MKKKYGIVFDLDDVNEEKASQFLDLIGRKKTTYITRLITDDLKRKGIYSVNGLTERDAKHIIDLDASIFCGLSSNGHAIELKNIVGGGGNG